MTDITMIAEAVRRACLEAALAAYEDAGIQGLCEAGRWEAAVGAVRELDLDPVVRAAARGRGGSAPSDARADAGGGDAVR